MIQIQNLKSISKVFYSGKVYNLELESKTHSVEKEDQYFIDATTGLISHNCFPKDINATITFANHLGVGVPLLKAVWNRNIFVDRPEKDWEELKGRAVKE